MPVALADYTYYTMQNGASLHLTVSKNAPRWMIPFLLLFHVELGVLDIAFRHDKRSRGMRIRKNKEIKLALLAIDGIRGKPREKEMATHSMFLPGESQGRGSLVGFRLWGHTESDTTEVT